MSDSEREFISFSPPCIGEEEIAEVVDTLRSPWITTGPKVQRFEEAFRAAVGAPAALPVNSCTAALHLALKALGIGPGDEVITSTVTFAATVNVIEHCGARPVLVDVEPDTLNLDPACVKTAVTPRTRAIMPVHFAGHPAEMDALNAIAQRHGLAIVEDAAHAFPASYRGETVGASRRLTAFSFYATKNYTTSEGGMLTGDPDLVDRARLLSLHGMSRDAWARYSAKGSWFYEIVAPGFKYNMTDVQAAIGLPQLTKVELFQRRREEIWDRYLAAFADDPRFVTPCRRSHVGHAMHLFVLRLNPAASAAGRDELIDELKVRGIGTSVHFLPIHLHPYYRDRYGFQPDDFPVAYANFQRMLSLPLHAGLRDDQADRVIREVLSITAGAERKAA